jgi:hypothetical protein
MPSRTPEQRAAIDNLPVKQSDEKCNARLGKGTYCKLPAGFRTDHLGEGRCYLHGGRAGRPMVHGLYSKKMTSTVKEEYEKLVNDPALIDLHAEFAFTKTVMGNFMDSIKDKLESNQFWTQYNKDGIKEPSAEAKMLMNILETMSRLFVRITDAESKSENTLNMKQVYGILTQIKYAMEVTCGECPVRIPLAEKLKTIKAPTMG